MGKKAGKPPRAIIEEGLQPVLDADATTGVYGMPDRSTGEPGAPNPLESQSWEDLREQIYGDGDEDNPL